jgi:N-acetylmuramoyl-L-alanine amidase
MKNNSTFLNKRIRFKLPAKAALLILALIGILVVSLLTSCAFPFKNIAAEPTTVATSTSTATGTAMPSVTTAVQPIGTASDQPAITTAPSMPATSATTSTTTPSKTTTMATTTTKTTSTANPSPTIAPTTQVSATPKPTVAVSTPAAATEPAPEIVTGSLLKGHVVVLDPGHQAEADRELEPVAPGSEILKHKTSSGTKGVLTRRYEYEVNLEIALKLKSRLEAQGCVVHLTRTEHNVKISNIERAQFAVSKQPDLFLRLHCNYSSNPEVRGIRIYIPVTGAYAVQLPKWSNQLGSELSKTTGAPFRGTKASSDYTGLNWADSVPSFLLEMGYMSNAAEDLLLNDPVYQHKIAAGIVNFVAGMPIRKR